MVDSPLTLAERIAAYEQHSGRRRLQQLGTGTQGTVLLMARPAEGEPVAVKFHERMSGYVRERDAYLRLRFHHVVEILGHHVPQLLNHYDDLLAVEMTVVGRPFVLDFGGAYLDRPPDYPKDVMRRWRADKRSQFGKRWPQVQDILAALTAYGIYLADVNPGNVTFGA